MFYIKAVIYICMLVLGTNAILHVNSYGVKYLTFYQDDMSFYDLGL